MGSIEASTRCFVSRLNVSESFVGKAFSGEQLSQKWVPMLDECGFED